MRGYLNEVLSLNHPHHTHGISALPLESLAFFLGTHPALDHPQLVVTETMELARRFSENYEFWSHKKPVILEPYSPHMFAGVELNHQQVHRRLHWLSQAIGHADEPVFVAPIMGLLQKTMPPDIFFENCRQFQVGDELPDNIFDQLRALGYRSTPLVEDMGQFCNRGGIIDIYSPGQDAPVRIELFDREIESMRTFSAADQRTTGEVSQLLISPAREVMLTEDNTLKAMQKLLSFNGHEVTEVCEDLRRRDYHNDLEYFLPLFYDSSHCAFDFFQSPPVTWLVEELSLETKRQKEIGLFESFYHKESHPLVPKELFEDFVNFRNRCTKKVSLEKIDIVDSTESFDEKKAQLPSKPLIASKAKHFSDRAQDLLTKVQNLPKNTHKIIAIKAKSQFDRLRLVFEETEYTAQLHEKPISQWNEIIDSPYYKTIHFVYGTLPISFELPADHVAIFSFEHFLGKTHRTSKNTQSLKRAKHLSFGELSEGDFVIHAIHGVSRFLGFVHMEINGVENEFLTLEFKGGDKLFLPIYRIHQIHKYSSEKVAPTLDKLGGSRFSNVKTKTKKRLREMAHDLIQLYAQRSNSTRPPFDINTDSISDFFNAFPFEETPDQAQAIEDVMNDLAQGKPMDRLICGDVGFGKTEVAMRAAFVVSSSKKQVVLLAPTTVLTMQHRQTFANRFRDWPIRIEVINRLKSAKEVRSILEDTKSGKVDILIGTHRLLSKDVELNNLGLLIIDEEQKFGVKHKEAIRKLKVNVDTLAMSATPIPRTLNMSLLKIRDLSLITTAPVDRLAIRTFICRHDKEIIKRAIDTELQRGGQVFFLHNRVQSIYSITEELRELLPGVPINVGHGQLKEKELESAMVSFFKNQTKVLVASAIIESGVDIPNANTILINQADRFGLSQLYQLRGRVGRSGRRAYCYLLTEPNKRLTDTAKERLRVIQENTSLGSGMQIAQYDLELRGAGTLLGEEQSGLIDQLGYEFYMQLLDEAIQEARGAPQIDRPDPEINLKIKAFIPNSYIGNIRLRLSYYRALTQIESVDDIDDLEAELKDQFGDLPEEVTNLLGLMLIRFLCVKLGVKDISSGKENLVLSFTDHTPLPVSEVIRLTNMQNKKYSIAPDNRLKIRMKEQSWPRVAEEIEQLLKLCP
jgi:transcription-repair coupling factor (superfamily II helicase)